MILKIFTLTLEPADPLQFSMEELRAYFTVKLDEYTVFNKSNDTGFIHRYPAVQCKQIKNTLMVMGISQGATLLEEISHARNEILSGKNICTILEHDTAIRNEEFGISGTTRTYEFLTPWLALNQQNAKKFYDLKGKPERDAFIRKILIRNLATLAKSLDYKTPVPITCKAKIRFRIDWMGRENVMVFSGKFQTNLRIPDYFGMGQSVSQGFGTMKSIPEIPVTDEEVNAG
ncbi:MAG: CRISPR-associated endonuclease Cas6 [Methanoregula sp.]|nr:CRISPR-associated endonuclease Cas6 [Methanoregula sp.]